MILKFFREPRRSSIAAKAEDRPNADVSTNCQYGLLNGRMKRKTFVGSHPRIRMATYWLKHKLLVDSGEFRRDVSFYYADIRSRP
jgi:hypothetical protein